MTRYFKHVARVIKENAGRNKFNEKLAIGDVIQLTQNYDVSCLPATIQYFLSNGYNTGNILSLDVEFIKRDKKKFKIGDKVKVVDICDSKYGQIGIVEEQLLEYRIEVNFNGKIDMMITYFLSEYLKCSCNFYEYQVYGCLCGRILS